MLRINELPLDVGESTEHLRKIAANVIGVSEEDFTSFEIARESIDSRKKNNIKIKTTADVMI